MEKTIQEIKTMLRDLIGEVAELKERVINLENKLNPAEREPAEKIFQISAESYERIGRLYQDGFHICPAAFGRVRDDGECLFCMIVLEKE